MKLFQACEERGKKDKCCHRKRNFYYFHAGCLFSILFEVFVPTLRAITSKHVEPWENGELESTPKRAALDFLTFLPKSGAKLCFFSGGVFSGISAVEILASLVGTAVFNPIYSKTNVFFHGFVYLSISVCQFLAVGLVL